MLSFTGFLFACLTSPKFWVGGAFLGLAAFAGVQTLRLDNAKRDQVDAATHATWKSEEQRDKPLLLDAQRDLGTCQTNQGVLTGALTAQNAAVAALQASSDQRLAAARAAVQATQGAYDAALQSAAKLIAAKAGVDQCASADALILGSLK